MASLIPARRPVVAWLDAPPWSLTKRRLSWPQQLSRFSLETPLFPPSFGTSSNCFRSQNSTRSPAVNMNVSIPPLSRLDHEAEAEADRALDLGMGIRQAHHACRAAAQEPTTPRQGHPGVGPAAGEARETGEDAHHPDPPERAKGPNGRMQGPGPGSGSHEEVCRIHACIVEPPLTSSK